MSFIPAFQIGQNPLSPNIVVAVDTSTGTDGAINKRRIYVQNANGTYLVPTGTTTDYTAWALANPSISLDILTQDTAASITVEWLSSTDVVLYTLTNQFCFALYNKQFLYYLIQLQGVTPSIPADTNYNSNVATFWTTIIGAINAVDINADIAAAQNSLNRGTYMRLNQNYYF